MLTNSLGAHLPSIRKKNRLLEKRLEGRGGRSTRRCNVLESQSRQDKLQLETQGEDGKFKVIFRDRIFAGRRLVGSRFRFRFQLTDGAGNARIKWEKKRSEASHQR